MNVMDHGNSNSNRMGISGLLAKAFVNNPLTPVLAIAGVLLGLIAILITPREEEPQIDVTMANIMITFPGASASNVEKQIAYPYEQILSEIEDIKHVYSVSSPGLAVFTVEFDVGIERQVALLRLYNQVYSNLDWAPQELKLGQPIVRPMGIDDVPVMSLTLSSQALDQVAMTEIAHSLETELKRVEGTRDVYTIGAADRAVMVELNAARLANFNLTAQTLINAIQAANVATHAGERISAAQQIPLSTGQFFSTVDQVENLIIGMQENRAIRLSDVADITYGADYPSQYVWHAKRGKAPGSSDIASAVTIAIAKKPGANAADITQAIKIKLIELRSTLLPPELDITVSRDYGYSASDKASTLIQKLFFATALVVILVVVALGWREAIVVGAAVALTLALTLFASWAIGFTTNRVSLFALIFSIGILVDDAIVIVENIHRHIALGGKKLLEAIPLAVDEVGAPTILATFAVIAALMPMAFVSGLMGPYMRPIPVNASAGMLISLLIALTVTPWFAYKMLARHHDDKLISIDAEHLKPHSRLAEIFRRLLTPFLDPIRGARFRRRLWIGIFSSVVLAVVLAVVQLVVLKMLPLDNKSEFQVVVDLPEGSTLENTNAMLIELSQVLFDIDEVTHIQAYAGTSAPFNFNGLVRQYYLRRAANMGDLQVNLVPKKQRDRSSHEIAGSARKLLQSIAAKYHASIKVTEVPPGPPVMAPLVAEVYGPDLKRVAQIAKELRSVFNETQGVVDIDSSLVADANREQLIIDQERAARFGISQQQIANAISLSVSGVNASFLQPAAAKYPLPIRLRLPPSDSAQMQHILALRIAASDGRLIALSELVKVEQQAWEQTLFHKDMAPVAYVTGDEAGSADSPLYGMFAIVKKLRAQKLAGENLEQYFFQQPKDVSKFAVKWDGEWQITFETFRDMGIAYSAGLVLIYLLLVAQFRSYMVPLIIMAPIPLTVIGVMPGHAVLGAQFTATSMIGMIALAGIIVRNSILLVDFINQALSEGMQLKDAVIEACIIRAQPIALTALAAMGGALFILDDPIFNGLAISLIFGILVSTLLTLIVIPVLYFVWLSRPKKEQTHA